MPLQFNLEPETGSIDIDGTVILLKRLSRDQVRAARVEARKAGVVTENDDSEISDFLAERAICGCENLQDLSGKPLVFSDSVRGRLYGEILARPDKRAELLTFIRGPLGN